MADSIFHAFLPGMMNPKKPTPINTGGGYGPRPVLGSPTPLPNVPAYNPLSKKKPPTATPIPGVTGYSGLKPPGFGRSLLGG